MFKPVSSRVSFPELEKRILQFWKERRIFERSVEERPEDKLFVLYEGPPTANGSPGIHHVLARVFKDVIPRYKTMKGFRAPRKGGWDTHGLPVELEVERELKLSTKKDIETHGIEQFNARCKESVFRYVKEWEAMTDRIGFWIDMADAYVTYENDYIESDWWILKRLWERDLIYQGYKTTPHCPRCGTSLSDHEVALGYRDDARDPSVYIKFRLDPASTNKGRTLPKEFKSTVPTYFLAWTTTPWTLPGNTALAVAPEAHYALVEVEVEPRHRERLILAQALLDQVIKEHYRVVATVLGMELEGLGYQPLYDPYQAGAQVFTFAERGASTLTPRPQEEESLTYPVLVGEFVSLEDGTGIVHVAPAFGEVDFETGKREGLVFLQPVDLKGEMTNSWPGLPIAAKFVKDADPLIVEDLRARGLLYRAETITHTYPFCWRCDSPLLYYAKTSWYIRTTAKKERLISANQEINWYPEHIKEGRFGDWLRNNVDWAISRERYWGTPLPVWRCEACGQYDSIGSRAELQGKPGYAGPRGDFDLHRPFIDEATFSCPECGGAMRRVPEVIDCWFDSGAMPYAQWHYPFENQVTFLQQFPADYICEAVDQTRGWFYSLHALSTLLFDGPCYRNVICLGHILDAKGEKMSKSRGNVVDPWSVLDTHGADATRWYLFTATAPGNPRRFSANLVAEVVRRFLLTLWNTYSFFVLYANIDGYDPRKAPERVELSDLDRWILSELNRLIAEVDQALESYDPTGAGRRLQDFVDGLSNWYVRQSRRRFWKSEDDADKAAAYTTLYTCLTTLARLLAPFTPFVAEEMYQNLVSSVDEAAPESVHLATFPVTDPSLVDEELDAATRLAMKVASLGRAARSKAGLKVRQPVSRLEVVTANEVEERAIERIKEQLVEELNVKDVWVVHRGSFDERVNFWNPRVALTKEVLSRYHSPYRQRIMDELATLDPRHVAARVELGQSIELPRTGAKLAPGDVHVERLSPEGFSLVEEAGYTVAIDTRLTPELRAEGLARELAHRLNTMRRSAGFEVADRIVTYYQAPEEMARVMEEFADYICQETLSLELVAEAPPEGAYQERAKLEGQEVLLGVRRAT